MGKEFALLLSFFPLSLLHPNFFVFTCPAIPSPSTLFPPLHLPLSFSTPYHFPFPPVLFPSPNQAMGPGENLSNCNTSPEKKDATSSSCVNLAAASRLLQQPYTIRGQKFNSGPIIDSFQGWVYTSAAIAAEDLVVVSTPLSDYLCSPIPRVSFVLSIGC